MLKQLTIAIVIIASIITTSTQWTYATNTFEELGKDIDKAKDNFSAGVNDGTADGAKDYRNGNNYDNDCPEGTGLSYCAGYSLGYADGWRSASRVG